MLLILILFIGILFLSIGWIKSEQFCPAPIIEYRYIPRTFKEEQNNPVKVSELFDNMFTNESTWRNPTQL